MDNEDQSKEVILQQMHDTRSSLADKLENLEQQVVDTVHTATSAVSDTVTSVKDAVHDTVATVKDSVQSTVTSVKDSLKDSLDIPGHVDRHPWATMAGSVALGYVGERFLSRSGSKPTRERRPSISGPENGSGLAAAKPTTRSATETGRLNELADLFGPEIATLKGLAIGSVLGLVRDIVAKSAPPRLREQLVEVINRVTEKLGGEIFPEMISQAARGGPDAQGRNGKPASENNHRKRFPDDALTQTERD
jgi:ElaB/YqjD/DUF883 family membrane-anchored ribosome-binding protein